MRGSYSAALRPKEIGCLARDEYMQEGSECVDTRVAYGKNDQAMRSCGSSAWLPGRCSIAQSFTGCDQLAVILVVILVEL